MEYIICGLLVLGCILVLTRGKKKQPSFSFDRLPSWYRLRRGKVPKVLRIPYRVEGNPVPLEQGVPLLEKQAVLSLFFCTADFAEQGERWWSVQTFPLTPGDHVAEVSLDDAWLTVSGGVTNRDAPELFASAVTRCDRYGFTLGHSGGRGHGIRYGTVTQL